MVDFRRITPFCLGYRLSKHKMTIFLKNFLGAMALPGYAYEWQGPNVLATSRRIAMFNVQTWLFFTAVKLKWWLSSLLRQSRRHGGFGGLSSPKRNMKHCKFVEFDCQAPPRTNVKPPYWRLSGDGSVLRLCRSYSQSPTIPEENVLWWPITLSCVNFI